MLLMKAIKPARLKSASFRMTVLNRMRKVANAVERDFKATTRTWEHQPKFEKVVTISPDGPTLLVGTDDLIYRFVNEGTKPHEIWAGIYTGKSKKRVLAFGATFEPKTEPRIIGSNPGFVGPPIVFTPMVMHPGTEAREFDKTIQEKWERQFKREMEDAMRQAARASGHGMR